MIVRNFAVGAICLLAVPVVARADEIPGGWNMQGTVTLRGAIERSGDAFRHMIIAAPEISLSRKEDETTADLDVGAEIDVARERAARIRSLRAGAKLSARLNRHSTVELDAAYSLSRDLADDPDIPTFVATPGHRQVARINAGYAFETGRFTTGLRGSLVRSQQGNSLLDNNSYQSNADRNFWGAGLGGRTGIHLTPGSNVFVDGEITHERYDAASTALSADRTNWRYRIRTGVAFGEGDSLSGAASVGYMVQEYDDAVLPVLRVPDIAMHLDWQVSPTGRLSTSFGREIAPTPRSGEAMQVVDRGALEYSQQLGPRWSANGFGTMEWRKYPQTGDELKMTVAGVGVSYKSSHALSTFARYIYTVREETSVAAQHTQRIEAGVRFTRP